MHQLANQQIWQWAGRFRDRELNVGAPPEYIRERLYGALENLTWQVENADAIGFSPELLAMSAHHQLVKIHPFVDGNGRITRLFADVLLLALTGDRVFDWSVEPSDYVAAVRRADASGDMAELLEMVGVEYLTDEV
jgi:fido (protein-threonine AMPylation protein)